MSDINVDQHATFIGRNRRLIAWPHFQFVTIQLVLVTFRVIFATNLSELDLLQQGLIEDIVELETFYKRKVEKMEYEFGSL